MSVRQSPSPQDGRPLVDLRPGDPPLTLASSGTAAIERLLDAGVCRSAIHVAEVSSTNTLALAELAEGRVSHVALPRLYVADRQIAGRGRRGRNWLSSDGSLTFTLVVESPDHRGSAELLSLAAGVGVARALECAFAPLCPQLKWPNDVYLGHGKVAGILCEANQASPGRLVIGIGLNVSIAPELAEQTSANRPACIAEITGQAIPRYDFLEGLVTHVLQSAREAAQDPRELLDAFRSRCLLTGHEIVFQWDGQPMKGMCLGISELGDLIVQTEVGPVHCRSGEVALVRSI